jgi:hypothetical protein
MRFINSVCLILIPASTRDPARYSHSEGEGS